MLECREGGNWGRGIWRLRFGNGSLLPRALGFGLLWAGPPKLRSLWKSLPSEQSTGLTNIWSGQQQSGWDSGGLGSNVSLATSYASLWRQTWSLLPGLSRPLEALVAPLKTAISCVFTASSLCVSLCPSGPFPWGKESPHCAP